MVRAGAGGGSFHVSSVIPKWDGAPGAGGGAERLEHHSEDRKRESMDRDKKIGKGRKDHEYARAGKLPEDYEIVVPEEAGMSSLYLSYIDDVMERSVREKMMKGMVTLVARHGKIVHFKAYGMARENVPMERNAIFRLASMSKTIGAAALMQLYDRGLVMPSDKLTDYIPEFKDSMVAVPEPGGEVRLVPPKREITIHDLLTMTSGITAVRALGEYHPAARYCAACYKEAGIVDTMHPLDMTIGQLTQRLAGLPLAAHPGERWDYSNLSSIVLGRIVEIVSGQDLNTYLKEHIFSPLGMEETGFFPDPADFSRIPSVYACETMERLDGLDVPGTDDTGLPFAEKKVYYNIAAGLTGTACDYFKFAQMLCNKGEYGGERILSPNAVQLMTYPHTAERALTSNRIGGLRIPGRGQESGPSIYGHEWGYMTDVQTAYNTTFNYLGTGSYGWHGYWGSVYNVWPQKDVLAIFLSQVSPVGLSWKTQERFLNVAANALTD